MKIINIFKMSNWKLEQFILTILLVQIAVFIVIGLDKIGLQIPLLRQLIAFFYLIFIPGMIIIRILKMRNLGTVEAILYSIGLSMASLMFIGLLMNISYPEIGIPNPISLNPLLITMSIFIFTLSVISCKIDDGFYKNEYFNIKDIVSPWPLFFYSIPFLVIISTYLVNYYNNVALIMFMVILISIIPILVAFNKIPSKYYPLAIFTIAIALLFHTSLISKFIWGYDVILEYHFADVILKNSFWDPTLNMGYNGVLSVVMLLPIYSIMSNMSLEVVIKVIYPFIFSFAPLGLFLMFRSQTNNSKIAFLSVFLFMSLLAFFVEMVSLARQEIAEFFLILLLFTLFSKEISPKGIRPVLYVIFGIAMVVSHYSIAFMYMAIFLGVWILLLILRSTKIENFVDSFFMDSKGLLPWFKKNIYINLILFSNLNSKAVPESPKVGNRSFINSVRKRVGHLIKDSLFSYSRNTRITLSFVLLLIVFSMVWYVYVSNSYTFINFVYLFTSVIGNITDFLNPNSSQGLQAIIAEYSSPTRMIEKYLYIITQSLILIGFFSVVLIKKYKLKFDDSYMAFCLFNLGILFASVVLPNFAGAFNTSRFYALSLIFLAPFFIMGSAVTLKFVFNKVKSVKIKGFDPWLKPLAVFLTIFLLFNSGVVTEFVGDYSTSIAFDKNDWVFFFQQDQDVASAQWLGNHKDGRVYGDYFSYLSFITYGYIPSKATNGKIIDNTLETEPLFVWTVLEKNSYVFIRYGDIKTIKTRLNNPYYKVESLNFTPNMDRIYDSNSQIYINRI